MWNVKKAKAWMEQCALDLISDGIFCAEGYQLLYECNYTPSCFNSDNFKNVIKHILEWDDDLIQEVMKDICK